MNRVTFAAAVLAAAMGSMAAAPYDAKTDQWATWGLDGRRPAADIDPPLKGRFDNGVATFFSDDTLRGKPVRLRVTWSRLTPTSARREQALSPDGGKTWETDWITDFESAPAHESADRPEAMKDGDPAGLHDFDFLIGSWQAHHRLLKDRLAGSHEWTEFEGTLVTRQLMNGWANMGDNVFQKPGGDLRGVSLRSFDAKTGQWAVWWLDGRNPGANLGPPVKGHFGNGVGTFFSADTLRGKPVLLRVTWSHITPTSAVWDQALSSDGGKTWETNWITEFRRVS